MPCVEAALVSCPSYFEWEHQITRANTQAHICVFYCLSAGRFLNLGFEIRENHKKPSDGFLMQRDTGSSI